MNKLQVVNYILENMNEAPVNSIENSGSLEVSAVRNVLDATVDEVLGYGLWFTSEYGVQFHPTTKGEILLPKDIIFVKGTNEDESYTVRKRKLYDKNRHTFLFEGPVTLDINVDVHFDDMPLSAQNFIKYSAASRMLIKEQGNEIQEKMNAENEMRALESLMKQHMTMLLGNKTVVDRVVKEVLASGWWFNTEAKTFSPNTEGQIEVGGDVIFVRDFYKKAHYELVNGVLQDASENTVFTVPVKLDVIYNRNFKTLPEIIKNLVKFKVLKRNLQFEQADTSKLYDEKEATEVYLSATKENILNLESQESMLYTFVRELRNDRWWFNTDAEMTYDTLPQIAKNYVLVKAIRYYLSLNAIPNDKYTQEREMEALMAMKKENIRNANGGSVSMISGFTTR